MKRLLALLALLAWTPAYAGGPITVGPGLGPYNVDSLTGLFQGTALQVGDVLQSGKIRKNWATYSDDLEPGTAPTANSGWGPVNAGSTIAYVHNGLVNPPTTAALTFAALQIGNITCANGSTACSAGGSDYRTIINSNNTDLSDLRNKTVTFSVWVETASGSNAGFTLKLARYQDNEPQTTTCNVVSTQWTRCVLIATFSNTSYTDNSEVRAYVIPYSTTTHYLWGAQVELGSVATPYQTNDSHTSSGSWSYSGGVSLPGYTGGSGLANGDPSQGVWTTALGVGQTNQDPYSGISSDGSVFVGGSGDLTVTVAGGYVRLAQVSGSAAAPKLRAFAGSPNGTITGTAGDIIVDTTTPGLWQSAGTTVWNQFGSVGAGGTTNTLAMFTGANTIGNSPLLWNGGDVVYLHTGGGDHIAFFDDEIDNQPSTNAAATLYLNRNGYSYSTTQFRSLSVDNGKAAELALFDAPNGKVTIDAANGLGVTGAATLNSTSGTTTISGATTINNTLAVASTATTPVNISSTSQLVERLRFSGQEWDVASHTDTNGPAFLLGVNRTSDRRVFLVDSANEAQSSTNTMLSLAITGNTANLDAESTDLSTAKILNLQGITSGPTEVHGTFTADSTSTFTGAVTASSANNKGTITLSSGTGTHAVTSGAQCVCSDTTSNVSVKCAVSGTTLTATGTSSDVIAYVCF